MTTKCDLETEFKCNSGNVTCIPRSLVNNNKNDCLDGSDEMVENFTCFEFEFKCLWNNYSEVLLTSFTTKKKLQHIFINVYHTTKFKMAKTIVCLVMMKWYL